jgi:hypothetical protein
VKANPDSRFVDPWEATPPRETLALGQCYAWALAYLRRHPGATLVHGTVVEPFSNPPHRFLHAWIVHEGTVLDWQCMEAGCGGNWNGIGYPLTVFLNLFDPIRTKKYTQEQAADLFRKTGHSGPWPAVRAKGKRQ